MFSFFLFDWNWTRIFVEIAVFQHRCNLIFVSLLPLFLKPCWNVKPLPFGVVLTHPVHSSLWSPSKQRLQREPVTTWLHFCDSAQISWGKVYRTHNNSPSECNLQWVTLKTDVHTHAYIDQFWLVIKTGKMHANPRPCLAARHPTQHKHWFMLGVRHSQLRSRFSHWTRSPLNTSGLRCLTLLLETNDVICFKLEFMIENLSA